MALGDSMVGGRKAPPKEAEVLREELTRARAELEAVTYALERCATKLDRLPKENKSRWLSTAERELADAGNE